MGLYQRGVETAASTTFASCRTSFEGGVGLLVGGPGPLEGGTKGAEGGGRFGSLKIKLSSRDPARPLDDLRDLLRSVGVLATWQAYVKNRKIEKI